jgi:peptidoglycan/LPS O-acetylase OafA/YrhL
MTTPYERSNTRLATLETGRGAAAFIVALYHASRHLDEGLGAPRLKSALQFGHAGVDFFFVLSGFIILYVHRLDIGEPSRLRRYVVRRVTRLWPIYLVAFAITLILHILRRFPIPSASDFTVSLFLLPSDRDLILPVAWTLQYEVLFYTIFGLLIANKRIGLVIMAIWFTASMTDIGHGLIPGQFHSGWGLEFFVGMAAAFLWENGLVIPARAAIVCGLAAFAATAAAEDLSWVVGRSETGDICTADILYSLSAGLIILGGVSADRTGQIAVPRILQRIGGASYAIYLFHLMIIGFVWQAARVAGMTTPSFLMVLFAVMMVAVVAGGVLVSEWVEQPLIRQARAILDLRSAACPIKNPRLHS